MEIVLLTTGSNKKIVTNSSTDFVCPWVFSIIPHLQGKDVDNMGPCFRGRADGGNQWGMSTCQKGFYLNLDILYNTVIWNGRHQGGGEVLPENKNVSTDAVATLNQRHDVDSTSQQHRVPTGHWSNVSWSLGAPPTLLE